MSETTTDPTTDPPTTRPRDDAPHLPGGPSVKTYVWVLVALMVLLGLTAGAHHLSLGAASIWVSMAIAVTKALLVALVFMHVWFERPITRVFAMAGLVWLAIMVTLTLGDVLTRF